MQNFQPIPSVTPPAPPPVWIRKVLFVNQENLPQMMALNNVVGSVFSWKTFPSESSYICNVNTKRVSSKLQIVNLQRNIKPKTAIPQFPLIILTLSVSTRKGALVSYFTKVPSLNFSLSKWLGSLVWLLGLWHRKLKFKGPFTPRKNVREQSTIKKDQNIKENFRLICAFM